MSVLRNSGTFNLAFQDLVVVRARAYNSLGNGEYSQINTSGATILTEPAKMTLGFNAATSTTTSIVLEWD